MTALCVVVMFAAIILCKARRFWILGCESRLSVNLSFLSFFILLLYHSTALLFGFLTIALR
jgi:hypothetical protein